MDPTFEEKCGVRAAYFPAVCIAVDWSLRVPTYSTSY